MVDYTLSVLASTSVSQAESCELSGAHFLSMFSSYFPMYSVLRGNTRWVCGLIFLLSPFPLRQSALLPCLLHNPHIGTKLARSYPLFKAVEKSADVKGLFAPRQIVVERLIPEVRIRGERGGSVPEDSKSR